MGDGVGVRVSACARACERACVRASVRACVCRQGCWQRVESGRLLKHTDVLVFTQAPNISISWLMVGFFSFVFHEGNKRGRRKDSMANG